MTFPRQIFIKGILLDTGHAYPLDHHRWSGYGDGNGAAEQLTFLKQIAECGFEPMGMVARVLFHNVWIETADAKSFETIPGGMLLKLNQLDRGRADVQSDTGLRS